MAAAPLSADRTDNRPLDADASVNSAAPFVTVTDGVCSLYLHIDNIRCAKCIHAVESALKTEPDVTEARVNMTTSRLYVVWNGAPARADMFAAKITALGYPVTPVSSVATRGKEAPKEDALLLRYTAVAGFAAGNIMLLSASLWSENGEMMGFATRALLHWLSALIALPTVIYAGRPFFASALSALKHRRTNMDVPISLAIILASGMSLYETAHGAEHAYFDSAVMLLFFLLAGRWLDAKARGKAREHAQGLLEMLQGTALRLQNGVYTPVAIADLAEGDIVRVVAGAKIPADAEILEGVSEIDTSIVTGESAPRPVSPGDKAYGGTVNLGAPLICRIARTGEDSLLAETVRLMEKAEQGRARYVRLADKAAALYTPVVHTAAAAAFLYWFFIGGASGREALMIAVTTLIITCPCALGLAVPAVQVLATEWLTKRGILVKTGDTLERLDTITDAVFDKTGTLTQGKPALEDSARMHPQLPPAAALAEHSAHPLSKALSAAYTGKRPALSDIIERPGIGIDGMTAAGERIFLGRAAKEDGDGRTAVALSLNGKEIARFRFTDAPRKDARETVTAFRRAGIDVHLFSGDTQAVARDIADTLHIDHVSAGLLPDEKLRLVAELQAQGKRVLMIGDGVNDAPALTQADVSISPAAGADITQNAADAVFQGESLYAVYQCKRVARVSARLVKQNFALAALYNCIAVPLAVTGHVTPLVAAVSMSASSLIVIGNAFRLRLLQDRE